MPERVIYVVRSWPRLSQTFIVNEVRALERAGTDLAIFSMVRSGESLVQPEVDDVRAPIDYLEDRAGLPLLQQLHAYLVVLASAPLRFVRTFLFSLRRPDLAAGYGECSTLECFAQAVAITAEVRRMRATGDRVEHLHAHFAHDPALVGLLAARLGGLRFSFTAHARDLLQIPPSSLIARAADAVALVTCCEANAGYIASVVPPGIRPPVEVIHHGIELDRFTPQAWRAHRQEVALISSVGRLVEKKGYTDLLHALARLSAQGESYRCEIYGEGPWRQHLEDVRDRLGLRGKVEFMGARDSADILGVLAGSDIFALTPCVTADGDRDGIPNVLVEAMACGVPVVTTSSGGIPELVRDGENGLVSRPGDVAAVAGALARLLGDPALRCRLGEGARRNVEAGYDVGAAARRLQRIYQTAPARDLEVAS
jgi:glycosyltransferase involved in cell wall biosynthesis